MLKMRDVGGLTVELSHLPTVSHTSSLLPTYGLQTGYNLISVTTDSKLPHIHTRWAYALQRLDKCR